MRRTFRTGANKLILMWKKDILNNLMSRLGTMVNTWEVMRLRSGQHLDPIPVDELKSATNQM